MAKRKILLIEDELRIAQLIKKVLEMDDFAVTVLHDGKNGLIEAKNGNFDLIVLDIMLPGLNGLEVCKELRIKKNDVPIIMLTARDTIEDRLAATDAGADDYLSKPFSFEELLERIKCLLSSKEKSCSSLRNDNLTIISDLKTEEAKIAEFNKRIMDNIPVSIITIDKAGFMTSANKYYKNLSKHDFHENNNIFTGNFFIRENLVKDYKKLLTDGTIVKKDYCYEVNYNGEEKYLKIIAVPLLDDDGNIEGALSMALDNTESVLYRKKLQLLNSELEKKVADRTMQLNAVNDELARVLELKSMFIADVSHEMRTSLAIMQGNMELMSKGLIEKNEKEDSFAQVFEEIKRVSTMLSDMTLLSESKSSIQNFEFEKCDINQLISAVCKSLKIIANQNNVKIKHRNSGVKIEIIAEKSQLEKLLTNLIRNAIRYNKENGSIEVLAKVTKEDVLLLVKDTGIGIDKDHLQNVFERFYRVDKARSRNEGGSGLGLAICKWVAEIHGGEINVESKIGEGSIFTVRLPINSQIKLDNVE